MKRTTTTGRLTCEEPNLQSIPVRTPEAKAIRDAFLKDAPVVLQNMDYSPFEARWAAELRRKEKK